MKMESSLMVLWLSSIIYAPANSQTAQPAKEIVGASRLVEFVDSQNDEQLILQARQTSNEAIVRQDLETITSFWLDDFVIIRGSGAVVVGKETNKADLKRIFQETPTTYFERIPSEIIISKNNPDLAWESGEWKGFNTYSKGGRYSAQWKKKDGVWKLQAELYVALEK